MSNGPEPTTAVDMRPLLTPTDGSDAGPDGGPDVVIGGRYRVEGLIATGGAAVVVRARDALLDREVAVKLLKESTDTEDDRERFAAETRTLARLSHPNLVTLLDAGTTEGDEPYLVMELVDGAPLSASLRTPLDPTELARIGSQVATALAYAHDQGVIHRDVKPGNVLVRADGRAKLADFGIARLVGDQSHLTRTGVVVGSVHYLAPEQVAFEPITPAVDVYALGLLILRALTGRHAFDGPTIESALARLNAAPDVPHDLPSGWRELVIAMTARNPADRPTAREVQDRLAWLAGERTTAKVLPPPPLLATPEPETRRVGLDVRRRLAGLVTRRSLPQVLAATTVLAAALLFTLGGQGAEPVAATEKPAGHATHAAQDVTGGGTLEEVAVVTPNPTPVHHARPHHRHAKPHHKAHHRPRHKAHHKAHHKPHHKHKHHGKH